MKKKVLAITAVGLILLGAVIGVALNAVFTVTDVVIRFSPLSSAGEEETYALQKRLEEDFVGKSTTFLDLEDVRAVVGEYPSFELEALEKDFPRTVTLTVSERKEAYAFRRENGTYAILDEKGRYLCDRTENLNRRKGENVIFEGFALETAKPGDLVKGEYLDAALSFAGVFFDRLGDARANIVSIALVKTENPLAGDYFLRLQMREGVRIEVYNPANKTVEKAEKAMEKYLSLDDVQRLYGFFDIIELKDGSGLSVGNHRAERPEGL